MVDTNGQSIADVENDKKKIGIALLENLHKKLSINLNWLICGTGKMKLDNYEEKQEQITKLNEPEASYNRNEAMSNLLIESLSKQVKLLEDDNDRLREKLSVLESVPKKQTTKK
jgi:hypothetical protein